MPKLPQQIQDEIFRKMPADKKLAVGSSLWKLGKELVKDKVVHDGRNRSKTPAHQNRRNP